MLATLYDVAAHPITEAEVDRVRTKAQKNFDDTVNDPEKMAVALAECDRRGRLAPVFPPPRSRGAT